MGKCFRVDIRRRSGAVGPVWSVEPIGAAASGAAPVADSLCGPPGGPPWLDWCPPGVLWTPTGPVCGRWTTCCAPSAPRGSRSTAGSDCSRTRSASSNSPPMPCPNQTHSFFAYGQLANCIIELNWIELNWIELNWTLNNSISISNQFNSIQFNRW